MGGYFHYQARVSPVGSHSHQKCDAKRPCTACTEARRVTDCEYETDGATPGLLDHSRLSFRDDLATSCSKDASGRWAVGEVVSEPPTNQLPPSVTMNQLQPEMVPPTRALICLPAYNSLPSDTPPGLRPRTFEETRTRPRFTPPPFSAISSLIFPGIPPQPHVVLSSPGIGQFQLSDVALGDLNMKLYVSWAC